MARTQYALQQWKYTDSFQEAYLAADVDDKKFINVLLPHTNIELPYNYFDERDFQFVSCYRTTFTLDAAQRGQCILLEFEGVMAAAEVYLNGECVGSHKGGYTPFTLDLTGKAHFDRPNVLAVKVDSRERDDIPPFGGATDYLTFGGIYRDVSLRTVASVYVENVFVRPRDVLDEPKRLDYSLFLLNTRPMATTVQATVQVKSGDTVIAAAEESLALAGQQRERFEFNLTDIPGVKLWDIDDPHLYTFEVSITADDGRIADAYTTRFGFRAAEVTPDGFWLNGRMLQLRGLNRHQTFPYVGQAMPARAQRKDADILKHELHLNLVRTSHYPQSRHFLDRCDELGLLVLEEIPGWQHIGGDAWKAVACENVREMITRDWNRPAIILWGVRINESPDDHEFYAETNRIAHELDPTRQTCGIRNREHSELLEDVYTMNDFSHSGGDLVLKDQREMTGLERLVPYMVTECNGHMYPTKRFDQEERLFEHALRHARVHSRAGADPHMAGLISWCAFDYNTHHNFGSGDHICYHGVMDMFRIPKMAAYFYRSQVAPQTEVVLEPATLWTRGERSIGGVSPLVIFTNCEYVECYYGDELVGTYRPSAALFPGLEYPPIVEDIDMEPWIGTWGLSWKEGRFVGYVNGAPALERRFTNNPVPTTLEAVADDATLRADGVDVTRVVYRALDQAGNLLPYLPDFLKLSLSGPGAIIGPSEVALIGGCIGVWIKAGTTAGTLTLSAVSTRLRANDVTIAVEDV